MLALGFEFQIRLFMVFVYKIDLLIKLTPYLVQYGSKAPEDVDNNEYNTGLVHFHL